MFRILGFGCPSNPEQCLVHAFCFAARPLAHRKCIDLGGFLRCSVRSASTRKARARATTATSASGFVGPYAITPGSSGISASQRPPCSRSNSTLNDSDSGGCGGFGTVAMTTHVHDGYGRGKKPVAENLCTQRIPVNLNFHRWTSPYLCSTCPLPAIVSPIKTTLPVELEARCEDAVAGSTSAEKVMDSAGEYRCNS